MPFLSQDKRKALAPFRGRGLRLSACERGSVIIYILMAIGLLAALTFSFSQGTRENVTTQVGHRTAEDLYIQASVIRGAIVECATQYPQGGDGTNNNDPDIDGDGDVDDDDNPNNPYPVNPSHPDNPHGVAGDDSVRNLSCTGAPANEANIFQGTNNKGRFLPPPPAGFGEWEYGNTTDGVYIRIEPTVASTIASDALTRLLAKYATCQADLDYGSCGANCLTIWVTRAACP